MYKFITYETFEASDKKMPQLLEIELLWCSILLDFSTGTGCLKLSRYPKWSHFAVLGKSNP